jgi:hypothetical protein
MSEAVMQCQIHIPEVATEPSSELSVGSVFEWVCEGAWGDLRPESASLRLDSGDQYKLKLLKFQFTSKDQGTLTVASYRPGNHQLKAVQLVDDKNSVVLGDLSFTVKSVLDPKDPRKEPFAPFGPFSLSLPIWYPLSLSLLLVLFLGYFIWRWQQRRLKAKLLGNMQAFEVGQDPYFQFYQSLRKLQRGYSYFSGGEPSAEENVGFIQGVVEGYKIYLARNFQIPTLYWSPQKILWDLKRNHKLFAAEFEKEIRKALTEGERALQSPSVMTGKDGQQLFDLVRKQVDQMEAWKRTRSV